MAQDDRTNSADLEAQARIAAAANRRKSFRVPAPTLNVKAWRMEAHERLIDRPLPSRRISLTTIDLGRGGTGALFAAEQVSSHAPVKLGDRIRLEVPSADSEDVILLEGRVTYLRALETDELRVGIEFRPALTESITRRVEKGLDRILADLQRAEIRKIRGAQAA